MTTISNLKKEKAGWAGRETSPEVGA